MNILEQIAAKAERGDTGMSLHYGFLYSCVVGLESKNVFTTDGLIPKFTFSGKVPNASRKAHKLALATATPITFPALSNKGPLEAKIVCLQLI